LLAQLTASKFARKTSCFLLVLKNKIGRDKRSFAGSVDFVKIRPQNILLSVGFEKQNWQR